MERGLEFDLRLAPGHRHETFFAQALGSLAVDRFQSERGEPLQWQVLRIDEWHLHHFRLVVRRPTWLLDLGLHHQVRRTLEDLSREDEEELAARFRREASTTATTTAMATIPRTSR